MRRVTRISAYHWYLASPYWKVRRRAALKRANYLCQNNCGQRATQVHHLTYIGVFNESPDDLVALCDRCHADLPTRHRPTTINSRCSRYSRRTRALLP